MNATLVLLAAGSLLGGDQQRLPREEAVRYARICVEGLGDLADAQVRVRAEVDRACAVRGEGGGAMAVPDAKLTPDALAKLGKDTVPVGQLWLRKWTVVVDGKAAPRGKLRIATIRIEDKDRPMPLLLLGMRHGSKGPELVAFGADRQPLVVVPLERSDTVQETPVDLEWRRGENDIDELTVQIAGRYRGTLRITRE